MNERIQLEDEKDYPFRKSMTYSVRCGTCQNLRQPVGPCRLDNDLKYPLMVNIHDCKDFKFRPDIPLPPDDFTIANLPECIECAHFFSERCDGKRWVGFKKDPVCEFYRNKNLICKNAVPFLQYGNRIRNNYCNLHPELRDGDQRNSWEHCCPTAHSSTNKKCHTEYGKRESQ